MTHVDDDSDDVFRYMNHGRTECRAGDFKLQVVGDVGPTITVRPNYGPASARRSSHVYVDPYPARRLSTQMIFYFFFRVSISIPQHNVVKTRFPVFPVLDYGLKTI